jgi:hypothetical protein
MEEECYYYESIDIPVGNLDKSVDCTYVLIMHNSKRKKDIYDTIKKATITKKIIIQYNYGYKVCDKKLKKNKPNYDLEHAYKTVFRHAIKNKYKRFLVLEDDCEFNERIRDPEIINDINKFLIEKDPMIYALGTFISFSSPINIITMRKHQLLLFTTGTHAVIYNEKYAREAIKKSFMLGHADFEMNRYISKYTYYKPLAYQKATAVDI